MVGSQEGYKDRYNTLFSHGVLILLLKQFISISKHVSSVEKSFPGEQFPQATPSYQCATSYTPQSAPNMRIMVSLNETKESSECLQVTVMSN